MHSCHDAWKPFTWALKQAWDQHLSPRSDNQNMSQLIVEKAEEQHPDLIFQVLLRKSTFHHRTEQYEEQKTNFRLQQLQLQMRGACHTL